MRAARKVLPDGNCAQRGILQSRILFYCTEKSGESCFDGFLFCLRKIRNGLPALTNPAHPGGYTGKEIDSHCRAEQEEASERLQGDGKYREEAAK